MTTAGPDAALELAVEVFPQGFCIPPKARHVFEFLLALLTEAGRKLSGRCLEIPVEAHGFGRFANSANAPKDAMIAAARSRGYSPADDNEADAIAILHWALETQGGVA